RARSRPRSLAVLPAPTPRPPLSPSTTLFRSIVSTFSFTEYFPDLKVSSPSYTPESIAAAQVNILAVEPGSTGVEITSLYQFLTRSEEHTSELQSRFDLVCRLLLDKNTASSDA